MTNLIAAVRSVLTYVAVSVYVLLAGPIALAIGVGLKNKTALYVPGHIGVGLALGLSGIRYRVRGREHIPKNRAVVFCSNHESNVDPPVLFQALHKRLHVLFKAELTKLPILGRGDGRRRVCPGGARSPRSLDGLDRSRRRVDSFRQLVPDFPRGHAQPDLGALAIQEGWLHHGDQGAGADRAGGRLGRPLRDAEGQLVRASGDGRMCASASRWKRRASRWTIAIS